MAAYINRYSGEDDFRFPALKGRLNSYKRFKYAARDRMIEVEGIFVYKAARPARKPGFFLGFLDLAEEYKLLGLKAPEIESYRIWCRIPANLVSRDLLYSKPNVRVAGTIRIERDNISSKTLVVERMEFLPVEYRSVGVPAFLNFDDMFASLYSRTPEIYEHGPFMLLASLIGSEKRSPFFPEENAGCGINIGTSPESVPGKVGAGAITSGMRRSLEGFVRKVSIGPVNTLSSPLRWNRFLSVKEPDMLARKIETENEIDWNLISDIGGLRKVRLSEFTASDINLVFDPALFPRRLGRDDLKGLRQTLLFAKSTPQLSYNDTISARIEVKTEAVIKDLAKDVEYAPLLFRYRFEPLCDAYLKGNHLEDFLLGGKIKVGRKEVDDFFGKVADAARDFAEYAKDHVETGMFTEILDGVGDARARSLYREMIVKGGMSEEHMRTYLMDKYDISEEKAGKILEGLIKAEPALVVRKGGLYAPVYS
jgi:hypothetical protein